MNNTTIFKILPYLLIAMFAVFSTAMVLEIHDINAELQELQEFKRVVADYKKLEMKMDR
jgi:hypothetical protein